MILFTIGNHSFMQSTYFKKPRCSKFNCVSFRLLGYAHL